MSLPFTSSILRYYPKEAAALLKTLAIQSVLFNIPISELERFCLCLTSLWAPEGWRLELRTGDCGEPTTFPEWFPSRLKEAGIAWTHTPFGENLGFGKGQNRLFSQGPSDRVWLLNPDTVFARDLLLRLQEFADERPGWGIVEPRLCPLEHPKWVDFDTYETGWCSGCAPLIDSRLFAQVNGLDEGFFLYSEDVDLSWRIKAAGGKLYCCPWASVYHAHFRDASHTERLWAQVSELLMMRKYRRRGHLLCRLADLEAGWLEEVLSHALPRLNLIGHATDTEIEAASWSGRSNTPLRWGAVPVAPEDGAEGAEVRILAGGEADAVETALGAWAAGAASISTDQPITSLPFPLHLADSPIDLQPGQVPFPNGFPPQAYLTCATIPCGKGWLGAYIEKPQDPANSVRRVETSVRPLMFQDREGYRFFVRKLRARVRLRNLPPKLSEQAKIMLG